MTTVLPDRTRPGDLLSVITGSANNAPRSLQRHIGPSQVGMPCERRLALTLLDATEHNTSRDSWPATVGTAVHSWLADAFTADNAQLIASGQPPRWLVEQRVQVRPGLAGSCDLYDLWTHTVIDHKTVGVTNLRGYRNAGNPGPQYRTQAHLYGQGWANAGLPVRRVAVVFYPRSGMLRDTWMWDEDYDPAVAQAGLDRMDQVLTFMNALDIDSDPTPMKALTRDTTHCDWCPFWTTDRNVDPSDGCAGPLEGNPPTDPRSPTDRQAVAGLF